jgi:hypothetical protein
MTDYIQDSWNKVWIAVAALIVLVAVIAALSTCARRPAPCKEPCIEPVDSTERGPSEPAAQKCYIAIPGTTDCDDVNVKGGAGLGGVKKP